MNIHKVRRDYARSNMPAYRKWCEIRKRKPSLYDDKTVMSFYLEHNKSKKKAVSAKKATVPRPLPRPVYVEMPLVLIGATKPTTVHVRKHGTDTLNTYAVSETRERLTVSEKVSAGIITIA
ncbi:MAG: hypothetical protein ACRCVX_16010 [Shewanella sp.]